MHRNRFFGWCVPEPFYNAAGDGGGGGGTGDGGDGEEGFTGEHPDFEFPGGAGGGEETPPAGAKPPAAKAGAPAVDPNAPPAGEGGAGAGHGTTDQIPAHRLREVIADRDTLKTQMAAIQAENARFKKLITGALGIEDPANPGAAKPLDERQQKIADRIVELLPWLKDLKVLAEKAQSLSGLADSVPEFQRQNETYWKRIAATTSAAMEDAIAPLFLGEGKTGKDLSEPFKARYRRDFIQWVKSDEARIARYESADKSLVDDYAKELDETVIAPVRRQYGGAALNTAQRRAKLPVAGSGAAPAVGGAPKKPEPLDEDSAADAAWLKLKELTTAGA